MKKHIVLSTLLLLLPLSHCSPESPLPAVPSDTQAKPVEMTDVELKTLASNYTESLKAINTELKPSNIHGARVKTFLDPVALEAYQTQSFPYADQTISVKESHASTTGPISRLYVMKKIPGYDTANNDWFYAVMSTEGVASQKGKVQFCIACHAGNKDKDYLFGFN